MENARCRFGNLKQDKERKRFTFGRVLGEGSYGAVSNFDFESINI
jgi:hypothetical protein